MTVIWAICRRDLWQLFTTPLAWLVLACWTVLTNGVFWYVLAGAEGSQTAQVPLYESSIWLGSRFLILLAPALTMNSFASERVQGTLQLLFTVPIREYQLVLGKFAASFCMLLVLVVVTLLQPLLLFFISDAGGLLLLSSYLGLILLAGFFAALGVWISLLVDSPVAAYVITMGVCLALFMAGLAADPTTGTWAPIQVVAEHLSLGPRLEHFQSGDVGIADIAWFAAMISTFLLLATGSLHSRRIHG